MNGPSPSGCPPEAPGPDGRAPTRGELRRESFALQLGSGGGASERLQLVATPQMPGVELLTASQSERRWTLHHETYAVCVIDPASEQARSECWYRGRTFALVPGRAMFVEPGELHATRKVYAPGDFFVVTVAPEAMAPIAEELGLSRSPHFRRTYSDDPVIVGAFEGFAQAFRTEASRLEVEWHLLEAVRSLLDDAAEWPAHLVSHKRADAVSRAREYLHEHFAQSVSLRKLALVAGLTPFHLVRSFARAYGLPPHAYQTRLRVAEACRMLREGTRPSEIDVGFADQSHLGRHFKRIMGMSPRQWAAVVR